jgi:DNA polymerase-3 subunit chi
MSKVIFYLLDQETDEPSKQPAHFVLACQLAANCFRSKQRCLVFCDSQALAEQFDELLWQLPTDSFVPHNLAGEGPQGGAPVEICWQTPAQHNRGVLINLSENMPDFHHRFSQIYDFVPAQEALKQQARDRYKEYRGQGHQLNTLPGGALSNNAAPGTSMNETQPNG